MIVVFLNCRKTAASQAVWPLLVSMETITHTSSILFFTDPSLLHSLKFTFQVLWFLFKGMGIYYDIGFNIDTKQAHGFYPVIL